MKKLYSQNISLKYLIAIAIVILGNLYTANGQIKKQFTQRTSTASPSKTIYSIKGDFTMIGNTNLTLQNYSDAGSNNSNMQYVDVDGDPNTFNSSSSTLTFSNENGAEADCSKIVYAGLYWTGRASNGSSSPNSFIVNKNNISKTFTKTEMSLKGPKASAYTKIIAKPTDIYYPTTNDGFMYSAYAEVTDYVKQNGIGEYFGADIALSEGNGGGTGYYGGWGLIVVYENSKMKNRDITIFDGHAYVAGGVTNNYDLPVSGFNAVQNGNVGIKLGLMAGEGDAGIAGDYFQIKRNDNSTFTNLSHSGNSSVNFFNSSIETGGNARTPSLKNNTGLDISMFNVPNANNAVIGNSQTSTTFKYGSTQDTYVIFAIAMAIDAYIPEIESQISLEVLNGNNNPNVPYSIKPGQEMEYKVDIKNLGTEALKDTKIVIPIPVNTTYVANSATGDIKFTPSPTPNTISYDSTVGANGSLVWNLGTLPLPNNPNKLLASLTFKLRATEDCTILRNSCNSTILVGGSSSATGATTGIKLVDSEFIQGYNKNGASCAGEPITEPISIAIDATDFVSANCNNTPSITGVNVVCIGSTTTFSNTVSSGTWSSASPLVATVNASTGVITGVSVGTAVINYSVKTSGCTITSSRTVTVSAPVAQTVSGTNTVCVGNTTTFSSTTSGGTWTSATPAVATVNPTTGVVTGVTAGTSIINYSVTTTGGCVNTASQTVTVSAPIAQTVSGTNTVCIGSTTTFSSTTSGGTWTSATPTVATVDSATGVVTGVSAGTSIINYSVTTTGGCVNTASRTVTVSAPIAQTVSGTNTVCVGNTTTFSSTTSGGTWTSATPAVATVNPTTGVVTGVTAGTSIINYSVTTAGGCVNTASRTVTVSAPIAQTVSGTNTVCIGSTTTFSSTTSGGTWTSATPAVATVNPTSGVVTGVSAGTSVINYSVTTAGGCVNTASQTVTVSAPIAQTVSGTNTVCIGSTTTFSSTTSGGTWTSATPTVATVNPTSGVVTGVTAGTSIINYSVTTAGGCVNTASQTVTVSAPVAQTVSGTNTVCVGNTTTFSSTTSGGTWISATPAVATVNPTTGLVTGVSAGTSVINYSVTTTGGCVNTASRTVTVSAPIAQTVSGTNTVCVGNTTTFSSTTSGGTWISATPAVATVNPTTGLVTGVSAGTSIINYSVTTTGGCVNTASRTVTVSAPIAQTVSGTNTVCVGNTTTFSSTTSGGTWTSATPAVATVNPTTGVVTGVTAGTSIINYSVTTAGGCVNTASRTVTVSAPIAQTVSGTNTVCIGSTTTFSSTTSGGTWTSATPAVATVNPTSGVVTGVSAGTSVINYSVTTAGGCVNTASQTVTVSAPIAQTVSGTNTVCIGSTTTFSSTTSGGTWTSATPTVATVNPTSGVVTGVTAGTSIINYSVTTAGGCVNTASQTVTVSAPVAQTVSGTNTVCVGNTTTFSSTTSGGTWISATPAVATVNPTTGLVTGVSAGTSVINYSVTTTGGCVNTASRTVTVSAPIAQTVSGTNTVCVGNTTTFSSTTSGGTWISATPAVATVNPTTGLVTGVSAGTSVINYSVTTTGGCVNTASRTVTVSAPIAQTVSGTNTVCVGNTTTFSSTTSGGTWTSATPAVATVNSSTGVVTGVTAGTSIINYSVTTAGGCVNTASQTVTVNAPIAQTVSGTNTVCIGSTTTFSSTTSGGTWTSATPAVATVNPTSGVVTGVSAGTSVINYSVTTAGGCVNTASQTVTVSAPIAQTVSGTNTVCIGSTTIFSSTTSGGTWTSATPTVATVNSSTGVVTGVTAGTSIINYSVTTAGGCINTASQTVTVSAPVAQTVSGTNTVCVGSTTTFSSTTSGGTWISATPAVATVNPTTGLVTGVSAGTSVINYSVTTTGGCVNTASRTVTVSAPIAQTVSGTNTVCVGNATTFSSTTSGGTWTSATPAVATVNSSTGVVTGVSAGISIINYSVTTAGGCVNTASQTVTVSAPIAQTVSGTNTVCIGSTTTFSSTTSGGTWTSATLAVATVNPTTGVVTGVSAGTSIINYSVTTTGGCVNTASRTVTVSEIPSAPVTSVIVQPTCAVSTGTVIISAPIGSNYEYSVDGGVYQSSTSFSELTPGRHEFKVRNTENNTCVSNATTVVLNNYICAIDDVAGPINGVAGGDSGINILDNDELNGTAVDPADVVITSTPNGPLTVNPADGTVTVAPNTPAGDYTVQYTICEVLNPTNCDTATVTVTVEKSPIDAIDDVAGPINGVAGGDSGINILDNDTLNGTAVNPADVVITSTPNGPLTVNPADGTVTVAANTPAGDYTVQYTICEVLNPTNCDTATVTVTVEKSPIDAIDDVAGPINGVAGGDSGINILDNDTLNGTAVNPADVVITSTPNGPLTVNPADGTVTVAANTPAGDYTVQYTICEVLNPTNCDTATVTVTVEKSPIDAIDDVAGPINGVAGGDSGINILDNDTLNGTAVNPADVVITSTPNGPLTVNPADGTVTVAANTPAGEYTVQYTICEVLNPTNCDTATVTVTVEKSPIDAIDDVAGPINGVAGGDSGINILDNDTLNGTAVNPADVVITSTPNGPLTVNPADGTVTVAPNTPAGDYTVQYTICEVLNPTNCDTATVTVTVEKSPIDAIDDVAGPINGVAGGDSGINILDNDTLNGTAVNPADVVITSTPNGPLTVNPADGTVAVAANTPAGTYTVQYTICEVLNPDNCDTATVTVTVEKSPIDAIDDVAGPINGVAGGDSGINILDNDTLNGTAVNPADVVITSTPNGPLTVNPADGTVTVAPNTPAGDYTVQYTICEVLNPTNCDTATVTVTVEKSPIDAIDDVAGPINGVAGGDSGINILDNDTLNGTAVNPADVVITSTPNGPLTVNPADGTVAVAANTPAGTYTVQYTICEVLNPDNCDTATVTVTVEKSPIDAIDDVAGPINGVAGGDSGINILDNDTLNGTAVNPADVVITSTPNGPLTVNPADGTVTVAPNTPAGEYTVQYTICEVLNPTNCDIATVTVTVEKSPIDAIDDVAGPINGVAGGDSGINILDNDTLNGTAVNPADVVITSTPNGPLTVNPADGTVTVAPNTPAGDYTVQYTICEVLNPTNCDTATVTVTVEKSPIDAIDDVAGPINGVAGGDSGINILDNDTLNGTAVNPADVVITSTPNGPLTVNPADGTVTVAPNTPAGDYTVQYTICEVLNPTNCDTATVTVTVEKSPIDAIDDVAGPINGVAGGDSGINVLDNDTLNGTAVNPADVVITSTPNGPLTVNPADGTVTVAPNTPAGDYTVQYTICEVLNPTNCDTATVTVTVEKSPIDAIDDVAGPINGVAGGDSGINVLDNDTLNGTAVNPADVVITSTPNGPLTVNPADGTVTVAPNTPAGDYTVQYTICEVLNPTNCDTATVTVTVEKSPIDAIDDVAGPINGVAGGDSGINILDNDTLNGTAVNPADVVITSTPNGPLTVNPADGTVTVAPNTPAGDYTVQYTICEVLNPTNCDTATVTVTVEKSPIDAIDDVAGPINGVAGGDSGINILDNDTLNGTAVNPADVVITSTPNGPLTVNPADGTVAVAANTPAGTYTVQYTICEVLNPDNCDTATVTVTVEKSPIDAIDDVAGPINGVAGGDSGINILDNDTLNGTAVNPADVVITSTPNGPLTVNPADGTVAVAANTPAGTYTVQYTICEVLNPDNCDTATVTVTVEKSPIDAIDDVAGPINGVAGGDSGINILDNDTLNGTAVNPADVVITSTPNGPLTVNPADGTVTVAPNTPAGEYTVQYTICEVLNPTNCDTATVTVTVEKSPIDAIDDVAGPINGVAGGDSGINILDNDTLNGTAVNPADVVITSTPNGPLTVNPADGTVTVAANTPAGDYTVQYTICEVLNPTNCDTATVTVTVEKSPIDAIDDVAGPINGVAGGDSGINILDNDTLNGTAVNPADVVITSTPNGPLTVNPADGTVTVAPNTPAGDYTVQYTICEVLNPTNCDTATVTVTVEKSPIDAIDDVAGPINGVAGGDSGINILDNDTLNGTAVNPADVVITSTPNGPLTVNPADGTVTVAPNTPAGEYTVQYTICEVLNPTNCDTATVTVTVEKSPIDAIDDVAGPINGVAGGDSGINILDNDTLNGTAVNPADVVITSTPNGPLTVNPADGTVTVAANTPAGDYTVQYTICEVLNPTNCDTATVTVTVEKSPIDAIDDVAGPINGVAGGDSGINILDNDTLNGTAVNPADVVITSTPNGPLTVNPADGTVTVAANTPAGDYTVQYTICEVLNPTNCDTATVTVTVEKSPIDAIDDVAGPINGVAGGDSGINILDNDTLNGTAVNPADVVITSTPNGPLTVNPADGTVTVAANTPAGEYTVQYTICEVLNPTNCDTATVTVTVEKSPIDAIDDVAGPINGVAGGDSGINILDNDTLNGTAVNPADVVITSTPNGPLTVNPADGTVTVAPNTPAGDYTVQYTICEVLNPTNCDTATVTVTVEKSPIDAIDDVAGPINGVAGGDSGINILDNDTLNGTAVNPADVVITSTPNGPLTVNPADGTVAVAANTPAGTYTVQYTICEVLNPDNCDTATVTVTVEKSPIDAIDDVAGPINGVAGGDSGINILDNDTLNGTAVNPADVVITSTPNGPLTVNPADGTVTVAPNTPAGDYTVQYTICEVLNPTNCDTATVTVTVEKSPIDAIDDVAGPINGVAGGDSGINILDNDTLNGTAVNPADVVITSTPNGPLTVNPADGTVAVAANTPAGTYTVQYTICEVLNPDNCDTATVTVTVEKSPIDAIDDVAGPINGVAGGDSGINILDNDTLNGTAVNPADVVITSTPNGPLTVNPADGTVTVAPNTPAGEYTVQYTICEVLNPTNCDTATVTVTVEKSPIDAIDDVAGPINGVAGGDSGINILDNDTLNGTAVNPADVVITSTPNGPLTVNPADGTVTVAPNTPAGEYTVQYTICEVLNPTNCDTATVTVTVEKSPIDAIDDVAGPINGVAGGDSGINILDNDTLNGTAVNPADVVITSTPNGPLTVNPADGTVTVAPNTPAGDYTVQYTICEVLNPTNCDTATVTVTVEKSPIDAIDDVAGPINGVAGGDSGINVLDNDTLNGTAVNPADVVITSTPNGPLTVNPADGTVTVAPNTPAGDYTVQYTICEVLNPTNCDTATVTVTVEKSPIDAIDDVAGPINGVAGGDSGINVLDNDTLNGTAVNPADVVITSTPNGPLTVNPADGTVTVAPNTPAGDYTVQYTICEVLNPTNCDTATVTVTVEKSPIDAIDDVAGPINGVAGGDSGINILDNDTLNGTAVNPADVVITSTPNGPLTVNPADGTVTVAPNTPAGDYTVQYTICEVLNPTNCDTATVTVTVEKSPIDAVDDTLGPINGNTGGTTPSVLTNDTLNGTPVNPADVVITSTPNGPLTVNPADGTVTVAPNTPAGEYTVQYTICEVLNPTNCDTATVTVTVEKSPIDAVDDTLGPINGNTGGTTPSVLTNDTLNGTPVNPADVVITSTPNGPLTVNPADGTVTVAPNTPAGEYTVQYTICEVLNPTNCDTATVTVTVEKSPIDAVDDTLGPINGNTGGTTPSVLTNDTLNGTPVNPADVVITSTPNGPLTVNPADGTVTVAPNTPAGEYTVQYTICEVLNPTNCDTATVTVTVEKSPIDAVNDTLGPIDGGAGGTTPSVLTNDTLNGTPVNPADVVITSTPNGPLTVNPADGTVTVAPNTPAGEYTVEYTICEVLNPTNCDTATVTVTVIGNSIVANDDNYTTTVCNTTGLAPVGNIFDNDLVNGSVFTADQVNFRIVSGTNDQIAIDALGNITLNESIVAGVYNLTYEICDKLSVANCSTADIVVNVGEATNDLPTVIEEVCNSGVDTYDLNTLLPTGVPTTGTWVDDNTGKLVGSIFTPLDVPVGTYNFKYTVSTTACPINMTVNMEVNDDCGIVLGCGAIEVHNAFSPNNDGINDIFVIDNIADVACYPENEVEIYNRWGVLVYKVRNYDNQNNSFRGISNGRTTISQSEGLPTGTYFYILTYKSVDGLGNIQNNKKDGYLYLSR